MKAKNKMVINLLLVFVMITGTVHTNAQILSELLHFKHNKQIPAAIESNVLKALSFYPELKNTSIRFIFKKRIKSSIMQAQPIFKTLFQKRKNRRYRINISAHF